MIHMKWIAERTWVAYMKAGRFLLGRSGGSITASPNPIKLPRGYVAGVMTLSWTSKRTEVVDVHVGAPDGVLLSRTGPSGRATTGEWVRDGMIFYLQDVSGGLPLTSANTLDKIRVLTAQPEGLSDHFSEVP